MPELLIRNSELTLFMRCQRSWMLSYYRQLQPDWKLRTEPKVYDVGNFVHAGVGGYYLGDHDLDRGLEDMGQLRDETYAKLNPDSNMRTWDKTYEMAERMLFAYTHWVEDNGLDVGEETFAVEERLSLNLGTIKGYTVHLHGQPDRIVRTPSGLVVEDWKTGPTERPFLLEGDWQLLNYVMMAQETYGEPVLGARHRRMKRSMHTARSKSQQFAQHPVSFSQDRLATHREHVMVQVNLMVDKTISLNEGIDPVTGATPNRNSNCNWDCAFTNVCPQMDDGDDYEYLLHDSFIERPSEL